MRSRLAPAGVLLATGVAVALVLGGCSGSDSTSSAGGAPSATSGSSTSSGASPSGSAPGSSSAAASPYLPVPDGVQLTAQGSKLSVGDHAVVAYEPRQDSVGVLDIKVTKLERTTFKRSFQGWQLDDATRRTTPYFVTVKVVNVGKTDLGGRPVPLYIVDGHNTLIESSTFASTFKPCPSGPFPKKFRPGSTLWTCQVYLAPKHGDLTAVSFRPTQDFNPITWTGDITTASAPTSGKHHGASKKTKKH
jgi:hypothetical protein